MQLEIGLLVFFCATHHSNIFSHVSLTQYNTVHVINYTILRGWSSLSVRTIITKKKYLIILKLEIISLDYCCGFTYWFDELLVLLIVIFDEIIGWSIWLLSDKNHIEIEIGLEIGHRGVMSLCEKIKFHCCCCCIISPESIYSKVLRLKISNLVHRAIYVPASEMNHITLSRGICLPWSLLRKCNRCPGDDGACG